MARYTPSAPFATRRRLQRAGSGLLLFKYSSANSLLQLGGTFTRADASTCASSTNQAATLVYSAANVIRNQHYINSVGPYTLLEGSRQNICLQSEDLATTWGVNGDQATVANQYVAPDGATTMDKLMPSAGNAQHEHYQLLGTASAAKYTYSVYMRYVNHRWLSIRLYDGVTTFPASFDLLNGVVGNVGANTTSRMETTGLANVYRCTVSTTANLATTINGFYCNVGFNNTSAADLETWDALGTEVMGAWGAQVEQATFPSSYIPTVASAVTRAADVDSFAATDTPQVQTGYVKLISGQPSNFDGSIVWQRGSNAGARLVLSRTSGAASYTILHNNGSASVSATVAATTVVGDTHELRPILNADGSVQLGISINGAAEVVGTASAANALTSAWGDAFFYINNDSTDANQGFGSYVKVVRAAGVQSLNVMRGL